MLFGQAGVAHAQLTMHDRLQRLAIIVWTVILAGTCGRAFFYYSPLHRGVYIAYETAGRAWLERQPLYPDGYDGHTFPYSPPVAVLMAPFAVLPSPVGSFLWRLFLGVTYLYAMRQWIRHVLPPQSASPAVLFLLVVPVTAASLLNANIGVLVLSLLLLSLAAVAQRHWNRAALFAVLPAMIKIYPLAVGLLLAVLYPRRLLPRLVAVSAACLGLSFLLQQPAYVAQQYHDWIDMVRGADEHPWYRGLYNCDLQAFLTRWLSPLSPNYYRGLQLLLAAAAALLCAACRRARWDRSRLLLLALALGGCWMTVIGPAVESFTYILIGPTLAWMLVNAWQTGASRAERVTLSVSWGLFTLAAVAQWFPFGSEFRRMGLHPIAGLLLLGCVLIQIASCLGRREEQKLFRIVAHPADARIA